jgi:tetratricopeptide (TPR) repeat protein
VILGPRNRLDEAISYLRRAVEINPLHADAYHNLAVAYGLQQKSDEAIAAAQTAVRLKPDSAVAQQQLQRLLAARGIHF